MKGVTKKQSETLRAIAEHQMTHGYPPTIRELCPVLGVQSIFSVCCRLHWLHNKGLLKWEPHKSRTLALTEAGVSALAYDPPIIVTSQSEPAGPAQT